MIGGFTGEGVKTVIPSRGMAKVSMRLVRDQDPHEILPNLKKYVAQLTTPGVKIEVRLLGATRPVLMGGDHAAAAAAMKAFEEAFGRRRAWSAQAVRSLSRSTCRRRCRRRWSRAGCRRRTARRIRLTSTTTSTTTTAASMLIRFMYGLPTHKGI